MIDARDSPRSASRWLRREAESAGGVET